METKLLIVYHLYGEDVPLTLIRGLSHGGSLPEPEDRFIKALQEREGGRETIHGAN